MTRIFFITFLSLLIASCGPQFEPEITTEEISNHIVYLASEELQGRYPGTEGDDLLSSYITGQYKKAGLLLHEKTGLQYFDIVTEIDTGESNRALINGASLITGEDFLPFSFSANGTVKAEVLFAGYGIQANGEDLSRDDYEGIDAAGKWVMVMRGVPGKQDPTSPFMNFSEDRGKALLASDLGAAGVILVSGEQFDPEDELVELKGKQHPVSIPVIQMTRKTAQLVFDAAGFDSLAVTDRLLSPGDTIVSRLTGVEMEIEVDLQPKKVKTANTVALLKGSDPVFRSQYVVIGAHHDHLGLGGTGTSSRAPDTIAVHYGADDNASGVAGVIEIAEQLVTRSPARSMLFSTFGAEEMGLVGSKFLTENPMVDLDNVQAMINLDMVGRLNEERQLQIGGVGTSPGLTGLLDSLNQAYGFDLKFANEGYGPSDHAAFYAKDVPVLFVSTGAHPDYHTPEDHPGAINLEGAAEVMAFVADVAEALANNPERITFTEAGPKVRGSSRGRRGGVTLGLMPDVTYEGNEGMPVMFVTEGKPAAAGGIRKGDVIVAIENKSVGNVYDYMSRLGQLKEGMDIVVTVNRNGDQLDLVVRL